MRSFGSYIAKHLAAFAALILILLLLNTAVFCTTFYGTVVQDYGESAPLAMLKMTSKAASPHGLSHSATEVLRQHNIWAMYLSSEGRCLWSLDRPEEVPERYTLTDAALFSRGYIQDYPVFVQTVEDGLLVLGYPKSSYTKLTSNYYPISALRKLPFFAAGMLGLDIACLFLAYLLSKRRILQSTVPIVAAIQALAEGKSVSLPAVGELSEIADTVCRASRVLSRQNEARANWIAGVSHDIRTPLSMILGYADQIAKIPEAREQARRIEAQSLRIKELVQDLNLISRLEYDAQPLQKEPVRLSKLLRAYGADLLNAGIPDTCSLEIEIPPETENQVLECDPRLLSRAVNNLVQNSIRHNPRGCHIRIGLTKAEHGVRMIVEDNGVGIPPEKTPEIMENPDPMDYSQHGLGLRIVRQIVEAHKGTITVRSERGCGCRVVLFFPTDR